MLNFQLVLFSKQMPAVFTICISTTKTTTNLYRQKSILRRKNPSFILKAQVVSLLSSFFSFKYCFAFDIMNRKSDLTGKENNSLIQSQAYHDISTMDHLSVIAVN